MTLLGLLLLVAVPAASSFSSLRIHSAASEMLPVWITCVEGAHACQSCVTKEMKPQALAGVTATRWLLLLCINACVFKEKCTLLLCRLLLSNPLAQFMDNTTENSFSKLGCSGVTALGSGGQGEFFFFFFYLGTLVAD